MVKSYTYTFRNGKVVILRDKVKGLYGSFARDYLNRKYGKFAKEPIWYMDTDSIMDESKGGFTWLNGCYINKEIEKQSGIVFDVNNLYPNFK